MVYDVANIDLRELNSLTARAGEALARLDERIARSPIRDGFLERQNFADAIASLWVDGELVHLEDLVLHDARLDIRTPTHELTIAHSILRTRRQIFGHPPGWALSAAGLSRLRGGEWGTTAIQRGLVLRLQSVRTTMVLRGTMISTATITPRLMRCWRAARRFSTDPLFRDRRTNVIR